MAGTAYTVKSGDTLTGIAKKFNLPSWRTLYDDPANADFRRKRPNPNLIFPGDVVMIPGAAPGPPVPPPPGPAPPPEPPPAPPPQPPGVLPPDQFRYLGPGPATSPVRDFEWQRVDKPDVDILIITKTKPTEFEWGFVVQLSGDFTGCFEIGTLQTMMTSDVVLTYKGDANAAADVRAFVIDKLPKRDHQASRGATPADGTTGFRWQNTDGFTTAGLCSAAGQSPSSSDPGRLRLSARVVAHDNPGGRFPANIPGARDKLLRTISQKHTFMTWVAVRAVGSDPAVLGNYRFLQNTKWSVERLTDVVWTNGRPSFKLGGAGAKIVVPASAGMGQTTPILVGPDANRSGSFDPPFATR